MATVILKLTGIRPLIMHNSAMIDPDNASVRAISELQVQLKKLKKEDYTGREQIRRRIERLEWEGSLYWEAKIGLFLPGINLFACIKEGAKTSKNGKDFERAVFPFADMLPIQTTKDYPLQLDKLYTLPEYSLRAAVRIPPRTGARLMKVRPMIPRGWSVTVEIEFDETIMPMKSLLEAFYEAGRLIGLGDWRPQFGRFTVEVVK